MRLVPGMGTTSGPCARSQASASCAGVHRIEVFAKEKHQVEILPKVGFVEAGMIAPPVVRRDVLETLDTATELAATERRVDGTCSNKRLTE